MIIYKTSEEIELIRKSSLLVGKTLGELAKHLVPGISTIQLDAVAEEFIRDNQAVPGFLNYNGFPNTLCISINNEVVHGIPGKRIIKDGDIVSIDCGVIYEGYYGDSAYTFPIGNVKPEYISLLKVTKDSLYAGINKAIEGNRIGDISNAIQEHAENHGYSVVRELVGHGVGKHLHESPEVPNYGRKGYGVKLKYGMVIAIEPMINLGKRFVKQASDGWTIFTADQLPSAHFEHTIAIGVDKADILSTFEEIEKVIQF